MNEKNFLSSGDVKNIKRKIFYEARIKSRKKKFDEGKKCNLKNIKWWKKFIMKNEKRVVKNSRWMKEKTLSKWNVL